MMSCLFCREEHANSFLHERTCNYPKQEGRHLLSSNEIFRMQDIAIERRNLAKYLLRNNFVSFVRLLALYEWHAYFERTTPCR